MKIAMRPLVGLGSLGLLLMAAAPGAASPPPPFPVLFQAAPVPNLAGYWKLDETSGTAAADSSGNGNNGTHTNGPTISSTLPTMANYACNQRSLDFAYAVGGPYKNVAVPDSASLSITGSVTVAAWIRTNGAGLDGMGNPNQQGIIEKFDGPSPYFNGYYFRLTPTLSMSWNIVPAAGTPYGITSSPRVVPVNTWTHVAGSYDSATGAMIMYMDGAADATTGTAPAPPGDGTSDLQIGADYGSNQFNGLIDEARVYNRALSAAEIGILMNGQPGPTGLFATSLPAAIQLNWTAAAGATGYSVYRGPAATGPWTRIGGGAATTFTDNTVTFPTTWYYYVTAVSVMESCPTTPISAVAQNTIPRTNDHDEGFFDDKCACGTAVPGFPPGLAWAALAAFLLGAIRRG